MIHDHDDTMASEDDDLDDPGEDEAELEKETGLFVLFLIIGRRRERVPPSRTVQVVHVTNTLHTRGNTFIPFFGTLTSSRAHE